MNLVLITIGVFSIAFIGMAIGVILSDIRIKGSCGGLGAVFGNSPCDICSLKDRCEKSGKEICEEGEESTC